MVMFPHRRQYHHNLQLTDGLTILANWLEIVTILAHYQPSYNTSHTMKHSDPLLAVAYVALHCRMYLAGKVDLTQHLATPEFPQSDHTGCGVFKRGVQRFLPKNHHTKRKLFNFENWINE